jgi:hypothetical protein
MENKETIGQQGPTPEEIAIIENVTGGKITTHTFEGGTLDNSFVSQTGEYIGDFKRAQWYVKNKLKVYNPYPHGVAELYNDNDELIGYYGYTHRGGQTFKIGDRLFDEKYEPKEEDYSSEQWQNWMNEYNNRIIEAESNNDTWWADDIRRDGISRFIPYKLRGSKIIENWGDAIQAAKNMSNHLS